MPSLAHDLAKLAPSELDSFLHSLKDDQALSLLYDWDLWARPNQLEPPGDWTVWLLNAGRGYGKTRTGAECVRRKVETGKAKRIALVGRTAADVRDVMLDGESGLLNISPPWFMPHYEPSKRRVTWPNGAIATTYSAQEPDLLRGPQHDFFWADEIAAWQYEDTFDQLMFGLRLGPKPCGVVSTTPRPTRLMKRLLAAATTHVTRGTTYENRANLSATFFEQVIARYEGTRTGRQELMAEMLDDLEGALWKRIMLEDSRVNKHPNLKRIVVAIDPAVTANEDSSETGIVVAGLGTDNHGYILDDRSLRASPNEWAQAAITSYNLFHADRIVGEVNNGGDLIETVIRGIDRNVSFSSVRATRGKQLRAEPVASLYERGLVHHLGAFPQLEDQMCSWEPGMASPDRLDALVWALTELMVTDMKVGGIALAIEDDDYSQEVNNVWQ